MKAKNVKRAREKATAFDIDTVPTVRRCVIGMLLDAGVTRAEIREGFRLYRVDQRVRKFMREYYPPTYKSAEHWRSALFDEFNTKRRIKW